MSDTLTPVAPKRTFDFTDHGPTPIMSARVIKHRQWLPALGKRVSRGIPGDVEMIAAPQNIPPAAE